MTAERLIAVMAEQKLKLAVAESLTGGLLAAALTEVPGASKVFLGSITAYQSVLKQQLLGVSGKLLETHGAVDPEVAAQMAGGVRTKIAQKSGTSETSVIGVATTGVAGPEIQDGKPVGNVFIALAGLPVVGDVVYAHKFQGDRTQIRQQTVAAAIQHISEHFEA